MAHDGVARRRRRATVPPADIPGARWDLDAAAPGRIVLLGIGMSNTALEFRAFRDEVLADPEINPRLVAVSGASAGQVAEHWLDPAGPNWQHIAARLRHDRVTAAQVQVAWVKLANKGPRGTLEDHGRKLEKDTQAVIQNAKARFPNLRLAYLSSRIYAGYATTPLNPEPCRRRRSSSTRCPRAASSSRLLPTLGMRPTSSPERFKATMVQNVTGVSTSLAEGKGEAGSASGPSRARST